ncbi:MAG: helix-turn-helix transcriptional regulator [Chloroflexi bacterium]|nr:helix-turn-helix transcriptional regulator [Chloroflexota bacterium]
MLDSQLLGEGLLVVGVIAYDASKDRYGLILTANARGIPGTCPPDGALNELEQRVLQMIASGAGNKQVARTLRTSPSLASRRVRDIVKKLGKRSRAEAIAHASTLGLLKAD